MRTLAILAVLIATSIGKSQETNKLTPEQIRAIRKEVYKGEATTVFRKDIPEIGGEVVVVPKALTDTYRLKPVPVIELLIVLIDGASPHESVAAASYAFELLDGPGHGVVCLRVFEEEKYEVVRKGRDATPRDHWSAHVRAKLKQLKEVKKK